MNRLDEFYHGELDTFERFGSSNAVPLHILSSFYSFFKE